MVTKSNYRDYLEDRRWSDLEIQPIAISKVYSKLWPGSQIVELDKGTPESLHNILDIAGADKLIRYQDGTVSFLAQRFRRPEQADFDDFTMRYHRTGGNKTEYEKVVTAFQNRTLLAGFYAYGLVNIPEDDFIRFRVLDYPLFLQDYLSDQVPPGDVKANKDGRTSFIYWPFAKLKKYLTYQLGDFYTKSYYKAPAIKTHTEKELAMHERNSIIRQISQSHLNPRMSLTKLNAIFDKHSIKGTKDWERFSLEELKQIQVEAQ